MVSVELAALLRRRLAERAPVHREATGPRRAAVLVPIFSRAGEPHLLGRMDDVRTFSSDFMITPFAGAIPDGAARVTSDREVARILEVPLAHLLDPEARKPDIVTHHWRYSWDGTEIWGATAAILNGFLSILGLVDPFAEDLGIVRALGDPQDKLRYAELMETLHAGGRSVADYVRQSPAGVATPGIRELVLGWPAPTA